jgi:hypothetical protein
MSLQKNYPFRRISVDHMTRGETRVWWQLERDFHEAGPYVFQLQAGSAGVSEAIDWQNVGNPVVNGFVAVDTVWRNSGSIITTHYRVTLTTPTSVYVSEPAPCSGMLSEHDWLLAREIVRKERLRLNKVAVDGYLIKALRYGKPCSRCRDPLTQEPSDNNCPLCNGTGFEIGFHPAVPLQCWDLSNQVISETQDLQLKGTSRENPYIQARVIGYPALNNYDIWVNATTDERWVVSEIAIAAALRGVPLIYQVKLGLVPFHNGIYSIELEQPQPTWPLVPGTGCVTVNSDWAGVSANALKYKDANGAFIVNAYVHAFEKANFDRTYPVYPLKTDAVASTKTLADGTWVNALNLDPGKYVLVYEKPDAYGPNNFEITVENPCAVVDTPCSSCSSSSSSAAEPDVICPTPPSNARVVNNFWDI